MKKLLMIISFVCATLSGFAQDITGTWNGALEVQKGKKVVFIFDIKNAENKLQTEIAIPSQQLKGLQSKSTTFEEGQLNIDAINLGFKYDGKWDATSHTIQGTFREGVNALPLVLTRKAMEEVKLRRPQEPVMPYPYLVEEVKFDNPKDHVTLAGTLTLPKAAGHKPPVVVLISGSGAQDRDESFGGHRPFLVLADYLTRNGIAVLRYDDRGFGESTGDFDAGTTADFATDAISAVDYLKKRGDVDTKKIGLIGHSEGAIIAPMAANQSKDVAFIVMLAGTGTAGKEVSLTQAIDYRNFPVANEDQYKAYVKKAIDIAASDKETARVKKELTAYYQHSDILSSLLPANVDKDVFIRDLVNSRTTPWMRYFYNYNPTDEIRKIKIPALAIYGSKDMQVPPKYHLQPVKNALTNSESADTKVVLLDGLNHLFQECETGMMSEYAQIEQTCAPVALETISTWVLHHTK